MSIWESLPGWVKIICFAVILFVALDFIHSIYLILKNTALLLKHKKIYLDNKIILKKYEIESQNPTKLNEVVDELDEFINMILVSYVLFNIEPKETVIVSNEEETKMKVKIGETVGTAISKTLKEKLNLFFSNDYIPTLISEHIHLAVTNYCLNSNQMRVPTDTKPNTSFMNGFFDDEIM